MKNHFLGIAIANYTLQEEPLLDQALDLCVSILREAQSMDGCYIYNNEFEKISQFHTNSAAVTNYSFDKENLEHHLKKSFSKKTISFIDEKTRRDSTNESEDILFRELMRSRNIESFFIFPIISNKKSWGFIAFENCKKINLPNEEVKSLQLLARNIGIRIYKDSILEVLGVQLESLNYYINDANQAMWELDLITSIPIYSNYWAEMIGYELNEVEQTYEFWRKNSHPEDLLIAEEKLKNYISNNTREYSGYMRLKHKNGNYIWTKYSGLLHRDHNGHPIKILGSNVDVTDLKEREIQLQISEQKYKFITENSTDIVCQVDSDGRYIFISKSYTEILGYKNSEMMHKIAFDFVHPDDVNNVITTRKKNILSNKHDLLTYRFKKKDNSYIWLESTSTNILNSENSFVGTQTCCRNVNERIEAAEKAQEITAKEKEVNQMKSDFVVMASHQFRTPLTIIYSNTELLDLKAQHLETETALLIERITNRIRKEVDRMTELMNNVLVFAKYESQKLKKEVKPIDFDLFIETLLKTYFNNTCDGRKILLTTTGRKKKLYSDESLLVHILTNLIDNAFKYSIGKTNPLLIIAYLENTIEIKVIDYGIGVPENEVDYLYTSFYRATNTSTIQGSGLGLWIVKEFTNLLNGTIELKTKQNTGTTIKLQFPYDQQ